MRIILHKMLEYYKTKPKYIHHFIKVHAFAKEIAESERLDLETQTTLEIAAYVHDIGIKVAVEKFGTHTPRLQEQEGPCAARALLCEAGVPSAMTERVCYLVGKHHSYRDIDGLDYQILVEADFLVNFYEENTPRERIEKTYQAIFKTARGKDLCKLMYLSAEDK